MKKKSIYIYQSCVIVSLYILSSFFAPLFYADMNANITLIFLSVKLTWNRFLFTLSRASMPVQLSGKQNRTKGVKRKTFFFSIFCIILSCDCSDIKENSEDYNFSFPGIIYPSRVLFELFFFWNFNGNFLCVFSLFLAK